MSNWHEIKRSKRKIEVKQNRHRGRLDRAGDSEVIPVRQILGNSTKEKRRTKQKKYQRVFITIYKCFLYLLKFEER